MKIIIKITLGIILLLYIPQKSDACWPNNPQDWNNDPNDDSWTSGNSSAGMDGSFSQNQNYILTRTYTNDDATTYLDNIRYFDGLGRPVETVQRGITPNKADLVSYQEYDAFGREDKAWLPAIAVGNKGAFVDFDTYKSKSTNTYNNTTYNAAADSKPYSYPVYERSPLNRITEQYGAGADWQNNGKSVKTEYLTNNAADCALFTVTTDGKLNKSGNYQANQLYVTQMTDEDGNVNYEFKDKLGQVVLTRQMLDGTGLDTYYVYDDFGNLCFVLPPMASEGFPNGSYDETNSAPVEQFAYLYKYDSRNRCIAKKLPGCDWVYYVYDGADRLIFTQDGENRKAGKWLFSIPDAFGRVVLTGLCKGSFIYSGNPLNTAIVKGTYNTSRTNLANSYTISGVTLTNPVIFTANFYDNYDFMGIPEAPNNSNTQYNIEDGYDARYTGSYKGMLTGTVTAQLYSDGIASVYLYSVMYYDYRGRLIQTKSNSHLSGGIEKAYIAYNFTGQPTGKKLIHSATVELTQTEIYAYTYDPAGRLTKEQHQLNSGNINTLAENTYDELGRLKTNKKGGLATLIVNYNYNIRSWIKAINNIYFSESLYYNESYGGSDKRYNGNLSAMSGSLISEPVSRGYAFSYDNLSRLTAANYLENGLPCDHYKTSYTYDNQGNIKILQRYGKKTATTYGLIDSLRLSYTGNRLLKVWDVAGKVNLAESADFKEYANEDTEYSYNANGAMTQDLNKGILDIRYNSLNLPGLIQIYNPVADARNHYCYSASGQKLTVSHIWDPDFQTLPVFGSESNFGSPVMIITTDYVNNMIYENKILKRILIDGGYIEGGVYHYYLTDHLGNNRLIVNGNSAWVQANHYYPFGMAFADGLSPSAQPYKYNGKELDQMSGLNQYDYSARFYDPAVGRFTTPDPLCEKYYPVSPYVYCNNNPVNAIDPTGRDVWDMIKFAIQHPVATYSIGSADLSDNISSTSARFAARTGLDNGSGEGSDVNAVRHATWQASITSLFGQAIAQQAGNAHEDNPKVDLSIRTFTGKDALHQADQSIDLLNNRIGQEIGKNSMGATTKEIANKVLDVFNKEGLFTATQNKDGSVTISRTKISDEQLEQAKDNINNLESTGRYPTEQRDYEEANRRRFEENQRQFSTVK